MTGTSLPPCAGPDKPLPDRITPRELAAHWRMSVRTLDRWRAEGYGPAWLWIGGRILYQRADIEAFEARHRYKGR